MAHFSTPPLFDLNSGNPLKFVDEIYPAKTRGMGLPYGENSMILSSTVFVWCDGRTDGRAIAYIALSIMLYAVAR